jgi:hypothetical protein
MFYMKERRYGELLRAKGVYRNTSFGTQQRWRVPLDQGSIGEQYPVGDFACQNKQLDP